MYVFNSLTGKFEKKRVILPGIFRCDTFVSYAYDKAGYKINLSFFTPRNLFNKFVNIRSLDNGAKTPYNLQHLQKHLESLGQFLMEIPIYSKNIMLKREALIRSMISLPQVKSRAYFKRVTSAFPTLLSPQLYHLYNLSSAMNFNSTQYKNLKDLLTAQNSKNLAFNKALCTTIQGYPQSKIFPGTKALLKAYLMKNKKIYFLLGSKLHPSRCSWMWVYAKVNSKTIPDQYKFQVNYILKTKNKVASITLLKNIPHHILSLFSITQLKILRDHLLKFKKYSLHQNLLKSHKAIKQYRVQISRLDRLIDSD